MCRRTGERKNEGCGGGPVTAVYLSPPCRNLYRTLSALIRDHSMVLSVTLCLPVSHANTHADFNHFWEHYIELY